MRFVIIAKATPQIEAGVLPPAEFVAALNRFNGQLVAAGVLLAAEGLRPSFEGARIRRESGHLVMTEGPFGQVRELVAGFWLIDVKNRNEALAWARRIPLEEGEEVELRQVFEIRDLSASQASRGELVVAQETAGGGRRSGR